MLSLVFNVTLLLVLLLIHDYWSLFYYFKFFLRSIIELDQATSQKRDTILNKRVSHPPSNDVLDSCRYYVIMNYVLKLMDAIFRWESCPHWLLF